MANIYNVTNIPLRAQDLRVMSLALKMEDFTILDEVVSDDVRQRIQNLPSAEMINVLAEDKDNLKKLQGDIGQILEIIEAYSVRDPDFKVRYKARTGLDPRYKVLEYQKVAQRRVGMNRQANNVVREMIRVSGVVDNNSGGKVARRLIASAQNLRNKTATVGDILESFAVLKLAGLEDDANYIMCEAALGGLFGAPKMEDMRQLNKDLAKINQLVDSALKKMQPKLQAEQSKPRPSNLILEQLNSMVQQLNQLKSVSKQIWDTGGKLGQRELGYDPDLQSFFDKKDQRMYQVVPNEKGEATVTKDDGSVWKVQEEEVGGKRVRSLAPVEQAAPQAAPQETPQAAPQAAGETFDLDAEVAAIQQDPNRLQRYFQFFLKDPAIMEWLGGGMSAAASHTSDMMRTAQGTQQEALPKMNAVQFIQLLTKAYGNEQKAKQIVMKQLPPEMMAQLQQQQVQPQQAQPTQPTLQDLSSNQLAVLIQQWVPDVWQEGYNGKAIGQLTDQEMMKAIMENVGAGSLPGAIQDVMAKEASKNSFNLKRYATRQS